MSPFSADRRPSPARRPLVRSNRPEPTFVRFTPAFLFGWWAFLLSPALSRKSDLGLANASSYTESGDVGRQLLVVSVAALGVLYVQRARRNGLSVRRVAGNRALLATLAALAVYGAWCFASMAWSVDVGLSARRLIQFALVAFACVAIGIGYYGSPEGIRRLARHAVVAAAVSAGYVFWGALAAPVRFFDPGWRVVLAGLQTATAFPLAFGAVAAVALATDEPRGRGRQLIIGVVVCSLLALFIQKDRVVMVVTVVAILLVLGHALPRSTKRGLLLTGLAVALGLVFVFVVLAPGAGDQATQFVTRGEDQATNESLTGRLPLWTDLLPYLDDRLIQGHGFGAFWNPRTLLEVQASVGWPAVVAHEGFLDEGLATGIVGLSLFMVFWIGGLRRCQLRARSSGDVLHHLVAIWLVLFLLLNITQSVLQTFFQPPFFLALTGMSALLSHRASRCDGPPHLPNRAALAGLQPR